MKLSILTVTFNTLATLKDAYFSLCAQTFTQWEWVVQDGGSTDGTQQWLESLTDERVNWVSKSDSGIYDALNKAISRAKGEWIGLLHSDDLYPNVEVLKLVLEATPGKDAIYGDLKYVQAANVSKVLRHWKSGVFSPTLLSKGWMPPHPTLFLKKEIYDELGMFNTQFKIAADYDVILRVFSKPNLQVAYLPDVLMLMRQGGKSSKWQNLFQKSYEDFLIIRKNGYYLPLVILLRKMGVKFKQFLK